MLGIQYSDAPEDIEHVQPMQHPDDPKILSGGSPD
jgi:hypothetical protein